MLDSVSAVFPTGKSVGILGVNGAGKSTLLRIIGGVEPPDHGTVTEGRPGLLAHGVQRRLQSQHDGAPGGAIRGQNLW